MGSKHAITPSVLPGWGAPPAHARKVAAVAAGGPDALGCRRNGAERSGRGCPTQSRGQSSCTGVPPVSFDGRWLGGTEIMLDRTTGVATRVVTTEQTFLGFVRDNPALRLVWDAYPQGGRYLVDASTGVSRRIDTDSAGAALVPAGTGTSCQEGCEFYERG